MALTQISTDGVKDGTITGSDLATNVDLVDNQKLRLGTGNDLQIYHDGSHSRIVDTGTGVLSLQSNDCRIHSVDATKFMAKFVENGAVELYHNNSKKFETLNTGIQVTGNVTPTGYMKLVDNMQIYFGTGNDLEILSDGTNGIIRNHVGGSIVVRANQDILLKTNASGGGADDAVKCVNNGAVELYFDGNKKFETLTNGVKVTGQVDVNGGGISLEDSRSLLFGASDDLQIFHDGSDSFIDETGTGRLNIRTNGDSIKLQSTDGGTEAMGVFNSNGSVSLYHNGSERFETTSTGFKTTVSNPVFEMQGTGNSGDTAIFLNAGANHWLIRADNSTSANTFGIKSGDTSSSTHRFLINSSGHYL